MTRNAGSTEGQQPPAAVLLSCEPCAGAPGFRAGSVTGSAFALRAKEAAGLRKEVCPMNLLRFRK